MVLKSQPLPEVFVANEQGHYGVKRPITSDEMVQAATTLMGQRFLKTICLNDPLLTQDFMEAQLPDRTQEAFSVIFLNEDYRIVEYKRFYFYTSQSSKYYLREIMKLALQYSVTKIVVGHRHSSEESDLVTSFDEDMVHLLERILREFDLKLLDYIVMLDTTVASYFQQTDPDPDQFETRYPFDLSLVYEYESRNGVMV